MHPNRTSLALENNRRRVTCVNGEHPLGYQRQIGAMHNAPFSPSILHFKNIGVE
jgi:hypothetical protein